MNTANISPSERKAAIAYPSSRNGNGASPSPSATRKAAAPFDVSWAMTRLRSTMIGAPQRPSLNSTTTPSYSSVGGNDEAPRKENVSILHTISAIFEQVPAILLITLFHLMIGIPFGVSYFPMSWSPYVEQASADEGPFPLPGKEALGIRMFLFSTLVGQFVLTLTSKFKNPIGLQMVENVPFCHELADIVIRHQGYGLDAVSTLLVMFGLSSIVVGLVFWTLGKKNLGRVVYFFPSHALIGCIGGIGVFLAKTGVEVTIADTFSIQHVAEKWGVLWVVGVFEFVLRVLECAKKTKEGKIRCTLLAPIYFCMITPIFFLGVHLSGLPLERVHDMGYFFPPLDKSSTMNDSSWIDSTTFDMWRVIDFPTVSWVAIRDSIPTLLALAMFSLIHVPINIPAFALSTDCEVDMNNELVAHGYANILSGCFGGLQNYMAYTQSVLYAKSGGFGRVSGLCVVATTLGLFVVGPSIAAYIPRCMAGTLLVHVGIDLFVEGVWDSYGKFDLLEYSGILLIVVVMTLYGMGAAMVAGIVAAVSTYVAQNVTYLSPIRGSMPATTLRSSRINRSNEALAILQTPTQGRSRVLVVQLQGHLFFGNMATFSEGLTGLASTENIETKLPPLVIIIDCSLVLGIDSSAAQAITKLKDSMLKSHHVELFIFVTGSNAGFPTEFPLTQQLSGESIGLPLVEEGIVYLEQAGGHDETTVLLQNFQKDEEIGQLSRFHGSHVCHTLDEALSYAEDALVSRSNASLFTSENDDLLIAFGMDTSHSRELGEHDLVSLYLQKLCPIKILDDDIAILLGLFERETYLQGDYLWRQHAASSSAKLLVSGMLLAELENEAGTTEMIYPGDMIGELGLVNGDARMSSVRCVSEGAVAFSLDQTSYEMLVATNPRVARYIDMICIKYLALRVQHVSNRIFETRCLPI